MKFYPAFLPAVVVTLSIVFCTPSLSARGGSPDTQWTYKQVGGKNLQMAVFLPKEYDDAKAFPTFVVFHGGSWRTGDPSWHYPDCEYWRARGMIAISVEYRLKDRDQVEVPLTCVQDAKSAIRYLRKNANSLKIDPQKIVVAGGSAGGQLAAATAMLTSQATDDVQDDLSVSCKPNAVVLYNPYFRCAAELSPPQHIVQGLPPCITFLGDQDPAISVDSLRSFHDALVQAGNTSEYYVGKGGKHGFCNGRNPRNPFFYWSLELQDRFLVRHGMLTGTPHVQRPPGVMPIPKSNYLSFVPNAADEPQTTKPTQRPKPNIVLILADDLGWQDVKCYDIDQPSPMETPYIDALAKRGVMFWQAYSPAPTCAPSRCAIMSGVHPARAQKTHVVGGAPPTPIHQIAHPMMAPWYSGRMPETEFTLAKALQAAGYTTGHSGKWHMAIDHHAFPQPEDQGFAWTKSVRGARSRMQPDRLQNFATNHKNDPYRLDQNGFPYHENNENALEFLRENKDKPFFLYYATWLVHAPIHTRSKKLLDKYCRKLGVSPTDLHPSEWKREGQTNPFYCAMVEELDYYLGKIFSYLDATDDPRWPGHKLSENTYLIFTSDNGGMEGHPGEVYTDNYPLDKGKISAMEGGTRVPLIITGPGIPAGVDSDVMVNGLDFYPTILSWVGASKPANKILDGCDLSTLLRKDVTNPTLVRDSQQQPRDTMVWHFPHGVALESTIRIGGYKLIRNYNHRYDRNTEPLELYRLYKMEGNQQVRVDIEEMNNLAQSDPSRTQQMNQRLTEILTEMNASYPYYNHRCRLVGAEKRQVPTVVTHQIQDHQVTLQVQNHGARIIRADLIYTRNGHERYEEWFRSPAKIDSHGDITASLPPGTTHFFINLIDEHRFLVSYPEIPDEIYMRKHGKKYAEYALPHDNASKN